MADGIDHCHFLFYRKIFVPQRRNGHKPNRGSFRKFAIAKPTHPNVTRKKQRAFFQGQLNVIFAAMKCKTSAPNFYRKCRTAYPYKPPQKITMGRGKFCGLPGHYSKIAKKKSEGKFYDCLPRKFYFPTANCQKDFSWHWSEAVLSQQ